VVSRFGPGDAEGWTTRNADGTGGATKPVQVRERGGNYFLHAEDHQNGKLWVWHAPAKFLGDHVGAFGHDLKYELKTDHADSPLRGPYVRLRGAGLTLVVDGETLSRPTPKVWTRYKIRLDGTGGWRKALGPKLGTIVATDEEIKKCLADLTEFSIRGEFSKGPDGGGLDNVELGAAD
jgi:hypothetical protein